MRKKVTCRKYKEELDGMEKPPFPGPKGEDLFNNVSKRAWDEWLEHQKMLINDYISVYYHSMTTKVWYFRFRRK